jgi:hypothetical protein
MEEEEEGDDGDACNKTVTNATRAAELISGAENPEPRNPKP